MERSEHIEQLTTALAEAAKEFPHIERGCSANVKTKTGASYSYSYADLNDVVSAVRGPLAKNGLVLSHDCRVIREQVQIEGETSWEYSVETIAVLEHSSGQWKHSSPFLVPCDGHMAAAQLVGSGATYGKRYTAQNILGLSTESDDDGNAAAGNEATTGKREPLPACPKCKTNKNVIIGKAEYGGGFVCFAKKGGCGEKWQASPAAAEAPAQPTQSASSGNAVSSPAPNLTAEDAKYIENASASLNAATNEPELRALWEGVKEKSGPVIRAALIKVFQAKVKELSQSA